MLSNMSGVHDPDLRRWSADEYPNHSARARCWLAPDQRQQASASPSTKPIERHRR
jgi:hypothetical protein